MYQDDVVYLNNNLSTLFAQDLKNPAYRPLALKHLRIITKLFYTLTYSVGLSTSMNYAMAIAGWRKGAFVNIFPSDYPSRYRPGGPVYYSMEAIEVAANFFFWTLSSCVDSLFGYYTLQMCGELNILAKRFRNLNGSRNYRRVLRECIQRHHLLMRCRDSLERLFGVLTIWIAVTGALIECTLIFQVTEVR